MASSVARMSPADDWRDPGCLATAALGRSSFNPANLRKVVVRGQKHRGDAPPSSSFSSPSSSLSSSATSDAAVIAANEGDSGSPATARKRQSQILDRWAAREAREMVTTIERQAHQAEISALTTASQTVSDRAKSLLREASPAPSESSVGSAAASPTAAGALLQNVRASSLIQMWRELEAEAGLTPKHRPVSSGGNADNTNATPFSVDEPSGGNSDGSEDSDASGDWDSDVTTVASSEPTTAACSFGENENGRVGSIVRMLSLGSGTHRFMESWNHENKQSGPESPSSNRPSRRETPSSNKPSRRGNAVATDKSESFCCLGASGLRRRRLSGRREMEDLVARMGQERRKELVALAERQCVSRFAYRGRLQSMFRLRSMRRQVTEQDQVRAPSRTLELNKLHNGATISFLRERFNQREHDSGITKPTPESLSNVDVQFPMDVEVSNYTYSTDQFASDNNQYQETISPRDSESTQPETNSPQSGSDDLQERSHIIDGSCDVRNVWMSNLDWQKPADSLPSNGWQVEVVAEKVDSCPQQNVSSWIDESSNSWRQWILKRQPHNDDWFQNLSDNDEIRDLLERKRVSTTLASDFCDKMNQMIFSFLQRQEQEQQSFDENFEENHEDYACWRQSDECQNTEQVASVSSSLVPLQYHSFHQPESWQHTSFTHQSSHNALDMEAVHDLRSDMAQIHEEVNELRKLVKSCMEWQSNLQHSIKQDILDAIRQSTGSRGSTLHKSEASGRKDCCCICFQMQVDSLFYRCGHMCACFKCANELQWSGGKCPICLSPIEDVVQAFPNS